MAISVEHTTIMFFSLIKCFFNWFNTHLIDFQIALMLLHLLLMYFHC